MEWVFGSLKSMLLSPSERPFRCFAKLTISILIFDSWCFSSGSGTIGLYPAARSRIYVLVNLWHLRAFSVAKFHSSSDILIWRIFRSLDGFFSVINGLPGTSLFFLLIYFLLYVISTWNQLSFIPIRKEVRACEYSTKIETQRVQFSRLFCVHEIKSCPSVSLRFLSVSFRLLSGMSGTACKYTKIRGYLQGIARDS